MRTILTMLLAPLFTLSASPQDLKTEIAKCAAIENSVERLAAYDTLAKSLGVAEPATSSKEGAGKWRLRTDVSPIDDSKSYILSLDANEELKVGFKSVTPTLIVRYKEGDLELFINYGNLFIGTNTTQVTTRIDKAEAANAEWAISTDHKAIFAPPKTYNSLTTPMMKGARTLVVRLTPYGESPVVTSFDVSGFGDAYGPVIKAMATDLANGKKKR
jgi:type VI secretion system protein VasI